MTDALRPALADYLMMRRALGYRLARPEKLLGQFLSYLEERGTDIVTVSAALDWAQLPVGAGAGSTAKKYGKMSTGVSFSTCTKIRSCSEAAISRDRAFRTPSSGAPA